RIDLATHPTGQQELLGPGGVSLRQLSPPQGDGVSSASAQGGGGGLIAGEGQGTHVVTDPVVKAYVAARSINAGGDVEISSLSQGNSSSYSTNASGGLIQVGVATSTTDYNNTNVAFVGRDGPNINQIAADNVQIDAGGQFRLHSNTTITASSAAQAFGGGFVSVSVAVANTNVTNNTSSVIGRNASIRAHSADVRPTVDVLRSAPNTLAVAGGFVAVAVAASSPSIDSNVNVRLEGTTSTGTVLRGAQGVDLRAVQNNVVPVQGRVPVAVAFIPIP